MLNIVVVLSFFVSMSAFAEPCILLIYPRFLPTEQCIAEVESPKECQMLAQKVNEIHPEYHVEWIGWPRPDMIRDQDSCDLVFEWSYNVLGTLRQLYKITRNILTYH